jgi:hypothetical protein
LFHKSKFGLDKNDRPGQEKVLFTKRRTECQGVTKKVKNSYTPEKAAWSPWHFLRRSGHRQKAWLPPGFTAIDLRFRSTARKSHLHQLGQSIRR